MPTRADGSKRDQVAAGRGSDGSASRDRTMDGGQGMIISSIGTPGDPPTAWNTAAGV